MAEWPQKKVILLWAEKAWFERMLVEARPIKDIERVEERVARFKEDSLVAEITWESGETRTTQATRLQPLNAIELRAFGIACIELAGEMERAERKA